MTHPADTQRAEGLEQAQGAMRVMEALGMEGIKCCAGNEQEKKNPGMAETQLVQVNESSEERRMSRGVGIERAE